MSDDITDYFPDSSRNNKQALGPLSRHSPADQALINSARAKGVGGIHTHGDDEVVNVPLLKNRTIDPRLARGSPLRGRLHRGKMVRRQETTGQIKGVLHFLFNPTTVSFQYSMSSDDAAIEEVEVAETALLGPKATCSYQLVFDRTYEQMTHSDSPGVLEDVAVLEHLMGVSTSEAGVYTAPQSRPVNVYFGSDRAMSFNGFFTSASVEMTHFTPEMIPVRLIMNISLMRTRVVDEGTVGLPWSTGPTGQPVRKSPSLSGNTVI